MTYANDDVIEPELVPRGAMAGNLPTPGTILTRMRIVDADVRAFDAEVRAHRDQLTTAFERGWAHWRDAWFRFLRENQSFAARAWPGTMGEVEAFAQRLPDWRERAERAGLELESPAPRRPPAPRPIIQLPDLPDLPNPREVGEAIRELREAIPQIPGLPGMPPVLTNEFWQNVKPVAIAGAVAVSGLALVWLLMNLRMAAGQFGGVGAQAKDLEKLAPMLLTRGLVR